jgi:hypothetical protein
MMKIGHYASALVLSWALTGGARAQAVDQRSITPGGALGSFTLPGNAGTLLSNTASGFTSGILNTPVTISSPGTGYVPGDVSTLNCAGCTTTTVAKLAISATQVVSATVNATGSSCTGTSGTVTGTTGSAASTGLFQATVTISGGAITGVTAITVPGVYTTNPTLLTAEPVTGASCTGATLSVVMGAAQASPQATGVFTSVPSNTATLPEASTTGAGTGATWTVTFGPIASSINYANLSGGNVNTIRIGAALGSLTTGGENIGIATGACGGVTTGGEDICIGFGTGGALGAALGTILIGAGPTETQSATTIVGVDADRNGNGCASCAIFGNSALHDYTGTGLGQVAAFGQGSFFHNTTASGSSGNSGLGYNSCFGAVGGSYLQQTCLGANTGKKLSSSFSGTYIGYNVAANTLATGSNNLLIDTGANSLDTPASNTSNYINIAKSITGSIVSATNPSICVVGMLCRIGHLTGANFNVTTDQAVTIGPLTSGNAGYLPTATKYKIAEITVGNCSISMTTAQGGFYTATSKGGTIIGATTTSYTACASSSTLQSLKGVTNEDSTILTAATLYLSLTTAQGAAATGDVDIWAYVYN